VTPAATGLIFRDSSRHRTYNQARGSQGTLGCLEDIKSISGFLNRLPSVAGVMVRGATHSVEWVNQLKQTMPNSVYSENGFFSTSNTTEVVIMHRNHNCHFFVTSKTGKDISKYAGPSYKGEREILFNQGTKFLVTKIEDDEGRAFGRKDGLMCFNIHMVELE
jgi:hypothetical protein